MSWNSAIQQQYLNMIDSIEGALDIPNSGSYPLNFSKLMILVYIKALEGGDYEQIKVTPLHNTYLTYSEMRYLHMMRVACSLYVERNQLFPWRLMDKPVANLRPLLSLNYQGFIKIGSQYHFHNVWDVEPGKRMSEATAGYAILIILIALGLIDIDLPTNEYDMIVYLIQNMRDSGWGHMSGHYDNYATYPNHGFGVYDYEIFREVKRTGCHAISGYLASTFRSFNIPTHFGVDPQHLHGHCYVHFSVIDKWFVHGDDLYSARFKAIPVDYAFKSDSWMNTHAFGSTGYEYITASTYESAFWWCFLLGRSDNTLYDVRYLFNHNQLRNELETLHLGIDWSQFEHPTPIPPIFDDDMVDFLMAWVEKKIANEESD